MPLVLLVDDEPKTLDYLSGDLLAQGCQIEIVHGGLAALQRVRQNPLPDLVLLGLPLLAMNGLEILQRLLQAHPSLKIAIMSNLNDTRQAVQAARLGAVDYLTKPVRSLDVIALLQLAPWRSDAAQPAGPGVENVAGRICVLAGPAMQRCYQQAMQVAALNVPVLLLGESGTGKDVLAHVLHHRSPQSAKPLIKVNCAALPADLLESELFGFEAGAFTGAVRAKPGKFELARGGTLFLDEIGEMPAPLQAKLLHVLQDGTYTRLGATRPATTDARIISATNRDLQTALSEQSFRGDLFYRLSGFCIDIPPLRQRREEIPVLLRHFMTRFAGTFARPALPYSGELLQTCLAYDWPGNLREMENFVKRYLILADETIVREELQRKLDAAARSRQFDSAVSMAAAAPLQRDLKSLVRGLKGEAEIEVIAEVLEQTQGVRKEAARVLNISYKALLYKLRQYGMDSQYSLRADGGAISAAKIAAGRASQG
ncbi:MAG: sigma-54-dependent transcriptional regulator [Terriglobales bacterium]